MFNRKELKQKSRKNVKRHYLLLIVLCAISVFFGTEFTTVTDKAQIFYDAIFGQVTTIEGIDTHMDRLSIQRIANQWIEETNDNRDGNEDEAAAERMQALKDSSDPHSVLGRQRGVLAALMNNINSGKFTVTLGLALRSIIHSKKVVAILMILASTALNALVWIFLRNMYQAVLRRAVLELRTYEELPLSHLFYFKMVRRWAKAACSLLLTAIYESLWWITIVGGAIKHYSYFLVPFIVAENPDIRPREAINLSRRMMRGHKWECFKLELSFLGWMLLGFFTFGILDILWTVPYRINAYCEYYAYLRKEAKASGISGAERLNDDYLFAFAEEADLQSSYADIVRRQDLIDEDIVDLPPVQRFFARYFGIWTATLDEKKVFSRQEGLRQQMRLGTAEMEGKAYPQRLSPLWQREAAALTGKVSYLAPCTIWSLIIVFFAFSIIGWLWEVSLHMIQDGVFVNRGVLHGPWLPIYGGGVVLIAVLLYRFRRKPLLEVLAVVVLCGFVEYMTSFAMEKTLGMRWWDYTGYYLNLNGRICGEGLAVFALGGMAAIYLLVPIIDAAVTRIKGKILIPLCILLLVCFFGDMIYSHNAPNTGEGITDYGQVEETAAAWDDAAALSGPISFAGQDSSLDRNPIDEKLIARRSGQSGKSNHISGAAEISDNLLWRTNSAGIGAADARRTLLRIPFS